MPLSILLVGCGHMGAGLARGWLSRLAGVRLYIAEPHDLPADIALAARAHVRDLATIPTMDAPDVVVLAVKPQQMGDVLSGLAGVIAPHTLVLSIAAGRGLAGLGANLPPGQPIIRAMPNLPAQIGQGITALCAGPHAPTAARDLATTLMQAAGEVVWIDDEAQMDAVTALSGSGPAYVFLLVEAIARAGEKMGLAPDTAMILARQTVIGAAALMAAQPTLPASTLRQNVTSPGGTTAAALNVLMDTGALDRLMAEAMTAAHARARDLGR